MPFSILILLHIVTAVDPQRGPLIMLVQPAAALPLRRRARSRTIRAALSTVQPHGWQN